VLSVRNIDILSRSIFSRVLFHQFDSIRVVEWDQCRYILLTTGRIDQRHRDAATLSVKGGALLRILFEKQRIVHLSYIDTRRIRKGSQSANNGTVDVLS